MQTRSSSLVLLPMARVHHERRNRGQKPKSHNSAKHTYSVREHLCEYKTKSNKKKKRMELDMMESQEMFSRKRKEEK